MIKENQIIDNYEIKLANQNRDDSLKKLCKEFDHNKIRVTIAKGKEIKSKFHHLKLIRSVKGELQAWEIHYKQI